MVHYVFTPWRDRRELLAVRQQFYAALDGDAAPSSPSDRVVEAQRLAVARVAVWMQRGHCPHLAESTALLVAARLLDPGVWPSTDAAVAASATNPAVAAAARTAYTAAFSRFVTGLLDGQQDRASKQSMHGLAHTLSLPAGFVDLRHQATHEALPSLRRLRVASQQALAWIWTHYWEELGDDDGAADNRRQGGKQDADADDSTAALERRLRRYVDSDAISDSSTGTHLPPDFVAAWGEERLLAALAALADAADASPAQTLRCIRLSRTLLQAQAKQEQGTQTTTRGARKTRAKRSQTKQEGAVAGRWTLDNLDIDAVRAAIVHDRQTLYQLVARDEDEGDEDAGQKEDGEDEDVDMDAESAVEPEAEPDAAPALPSRPRWTRSADDWTPRPIGVV